MRPLQTRYPSLPSAYYFYSNQRMISRISKSLAEPMPLGKGSVQVSRTYAVVARALFKLSLYEAVVLQKDLSVKDVPKLTLFPSRFIPGNPNPWRHGRRAWGAPQVRSSRPLLLCHRTQLNEGGPPDFYPCYTKSDIVWTRRARFHNERELN